jgi:hypothetical protein
MHVVSATAAPPENIPLAEDQVIQVRTIGQQTNLIWPECNPNFFQLFSYFPQFFILFYTFPVFSNVHFPFIIIHHFTFNLFNSYHMLFYTRLSFIFLVFLHNLSPSFLSSSILLSPFLLFLTFPTLLILLNSSGLFYLNFPSSLLIVNFLIPCSLSFISSIIFFFLLIPLSCFLFYRVLPLLSSFMQYATFSVHLPFLS